MNKILCDICGSTYPETSECCPICGSSREFGSENPDYVPARMPEYVPEGKKKAGLFSAAARKMQDGLYERDLPEFDSPMDILPETDRTGGASDGYSEKKRHTSYFLVILLTALIGLCVLASLFLFFRYYLPHHISGAPEHPVQTTEPLETQTEETSAPTVPCSGIVLTSGVPEIDRIGQYWLLHVIVMPEDTTDQLSYVSSDESVVTVTEEGRLCAVGEGQATVLITCGNEQILCQVTVKLPEPTGVTESPSEPVAHSDEETEETEPVTEEAEQTETSEEVVLKLKQTDISFTKKGVTFQLELDCDLRPEDVSWLTLDPDIAICHDGVITVLGNGTTRIVAQYGGQEVYCIVRCNFK